MLSFTIPPDTRYTLNHLCLDLNGTICFGGALIPGVAERVTALAEHLSVHVITADTNGNAAKLLHGLPLTLHCIGPSDQSSAKLTYIRQLGSKQCVCMGNGSNDALMLGEAGLSIAILGREGASRQALAAAELVICGITDALDLLTHPERLIATLRG